MSNRTHQFILLVNNLSGISFLKYKDKSLQISRVMIITSFLKIVGINITVWKIYTDESLMSRIMLPEISPMNTSPFSKILVLAGSGVIYMVTAFICLSHVRKRYQILKLWQDCLTLVQTDEKFSLIERVCRRNLILIVVLLSLLVTLESAMVQKSWVSFLFLYCSLQPLTVMLCFLNFMKMSELFFSACLKIYRNNLNLIFKRRVRTPSTCLELILQYDKIFKINQNYNKTFGRSMSLMIGCFTAATTIQVRNFFHPSL